MTNLTATILNASNGSTLTINGKDLKVIGGAGCPVLSCRGARGADVLLVQNKSNPDVWFVIRGRVSDRVQTAA
jgi:hypothetical protein